MRLSPEQLQKFDDDGYLFLPDCFSDEEVGVLRREAEAIYRSERPEVWQEDSAIIPYLFKSRYLIAATGIGGYDAAVSSVQTAHAWNVYNWTKD